MFVILVKDVEDSPSTSTSTKDKTAVDKDSDVSDVEQEGYCDDSSTNNIQLIMRLRRVTEDRIKKLYHNTDDVSILTYQH